MRISFYILFFIICSLNLYAQKDFNTYELGQYLSNEQLEEVDSLLLATVDELKQDESYLEMTQLIYYVGRIQLLKTNEEDAINAAIVFSEEIFNQDSSPRVKREAYIVLHRFYAYLRKYDKSLEESLKALQQTKNIPNATGDLFGLIHQNIGVDYRKLGQLKKSIWHTKKALEYYLSYPGSDKEKVLENYNSLGARMWDQFKIDSAVYYFKRAYKLIDTMDPIPMNQYYHAAKVESNLSSAFAELGQMDSSFVYSEKSVRHYGQFLSVESDKSDFFMEQARMFWFISIENYAGAFSDRGEFVKAKEILEYIYEAKLKSLPENDPEIAYTGILLANALLKLKDHNNAELYVNRALKIYSLNPEQNYFGLADSYYYKGLVEEYKGNVQDARSNYEKSQTYYQQIFGDSFDAFYLDAMSTYANFYYNNEFYEKALETAQIAYDYISKTQKNPTVLEYSHLITLASISFKMKKLNEADEYITDALSLLEDQAKDDGYGPNLKLPIALLWQSKIEMARNSIQSEKELVFQFEKMQKAIEIIENRKGLIGNDRSLSVLLDDFDMVFEHTKELGWKLYAFTNKQFYLEQVLLIHESKVYNRIRRHLNAKSNVGAYGVSEHLIDRENELKARLNSVLGTDVDIERYVDINQEWERFLDTLKLQNPKYYGLKYGKIESDFLAIKKKLPENSSVVRYMLINEDLFAIVLDRNKLYGFRLKGHEQLIQNERDLNKTLHEDFLNYNRLYELLWEQIDSVVTNENVIIIPDSGIFNISFDMLTPNEVNSYEELVSTCNINRYRYSYNYSLLLVDADKPPTFFKDNFVAFSPEFDDSMKTEYLAAVSDSVFIDKTYLTLLPQPFSKNMAQTYSRVFKGKSFVNEQASKQIFTSNAKEHKIIHIGTHAESNNVAPQLSRLIFAKDVREENSIIDNSLYTYEIYDQDLSSNLAILTACETGKPTYQAGEGMISLAHAFNYAGSESMLTSLWKIDEKSSMQILDGFYKYLQADLPKDEALQKAKLDYLKVSKGRLLSPDYWAGLVIIGDVQPINIDAPSFIVSWFMALGIVIVLILWQFKTNRQI